MTARRRAVGELLPVEALDQDGLLVRSDGAFVRYLQVVPSNPLVLDEQGCDRMTRGLTDLLLRVPTGTSVQLSAADGDIYDWAYSWDEWLAKGTPSS